MRNTLISLAKEYQPPGLAPPGIYTRSEELSFVLTQRF